MQTARNYVNDGANHMDQALARMPVGSIKLPTSFHEVTRYVEQLLTPAEQAACDRATD